MLLRVLVTGGAGFIGSHVVERFVDKGDEVLVVDDLSTGSRDNLEDGVDLVEIDIVNPSLDRVVNKFRPNVVCHMAAQSAVSASATEPEADARTNIMGGLNLLKCVVGAGVSQFIYITTGGALYGEPDYIPSDEDHPIRPNSPYGISKWTFEQYLKIGNLSGVCPKVLRLSNVYGPRQDPFGEAGVVSIFASRMLKDKSVTIFGDGEQLRDFVYVKDVVDANEKAVATVNPVTVNVSSGVGISINELFSNLALKTGYKKPPIYETRRSGDLERSVLSNHRANSLFGWTPNTSFETGLSKTVEWLQTNVQGD